MRKQEALFFIVREGGQDIFYILQVNYGLYDSMSIREARKKLIF